MAFADAVGRMKDRQYATMGVPARWTPAGGAPLDFTALVCGGDEVADFRGFTSQKIVSATWFRARVSELAALAPVVTPGSGDAVDQLDTNGNVVASFVIVGDVQHPAGDARRLEWQLNLTGA